VVYVLDVRVGDVPGVPASTYSSPRSLNIGVHGLGRGFKPKKKG
jgi:hypothetical protein